MAGPQAAKAAVQAVTYDAVQAAPRRAPKQLCASRSPAQRRGRAEHEVRLAAEAVEDARKLNGDVAVKIIWQEVG